MSENKYSVTEKPSPPPDNLMIAPYNTVLTAPTASCLEFRASYAAAGCAYVLHVNVNERV